MAALLVGLVSIGLSVAHADRVHRVRRGDTLIRIARHFDVPVATLKRANRLRSDRIRVGMRLRIPGADDGRGAQPAETTAAQDEARKAAEALGLGSSKVAHALLDNPPEPAWVEAAGSTEMSGTLRLPVEDGRLLRGWGSGRGGYHLALDLGAKRGTPVHAAEAGLVAYAGNAVRGYGNIVILIHPNGWVTWYAHHQQNLVVAGEHVERGQPIGTVGSTGYAHGAHLHLMLVVDGQHCDAQPLLAPSLDDTPTDPPDDLRCRPRRSRR